MARIRKERRIKRGTKDPSRLSRGVGKKSKISKQQVLALGGDEHDYDLVKDVEDAGSGEEDVRIFRMVAFNDLSLRSQHCPKTYPSS